MEKIKGVLSRNTIIPIFIVFFLAASIFVPGFLSVNNLFNIFNQNAMKGIMAIGMTFVIINSYFDMSLCTLVALAASLACGLEATPVGMIGGIIVALLVGILVGSINGFLVAYAKINAFVVTLAMMLGCRGIGYIYHAEESLMPSHTDLGWAFIDFAAGEIDAVFTYDDNGAYGAWNAIEAAGRQDDVKIFAAAAGSYETLDYIRDGKIAATAMQSPRFDAGETLVMAIKLAKGEEPEEFYNYITTPVATAENVDDLGLEAW